MADYIQNKKAGLNYEILDTYVAGIELFGFEVKSVRKNHGSLEGAYVSFVDGEVYLRGMHIPPFQEANSPENFDTRRDRKLLLNKKEIKELQKAKESAGLTTIPLSLYNSGRKIKVKLAVARGKKKYDKRETIKKKDQQRDLDRSLKKRF